MMDFTYEELEATSSDSLGNQGLLAESCDVRVNPIYTSTPLY